MLEPLERIVLADEECVSRLDFAAKRADREIEQARTEHEQALAAARKEFSDDVEREIERIRGEGEQRIREKRAALDEYLQRLAAAAEERLEPAAERYARIVAGEPEVEA